MRKIPTWVIVILIFALLIGIKFLFFGKKDDKGAAAKGKTNVPVTANYFVARPFEFTNKVYSSGKIGALNEVELKPETAGKVISILFTEGEEVRKGQLLVKMNDAALQTQMQKIKIQIKLAEEKSERLKKLYAVNGVSKEEYDIQENETASLKADLAHLNAQLDETMILAPFDGTIGLKNISVGAYVNQQQTIAQLVQTRPVFIEFSVPEKHSAKLKKGLGIKFSSDKEGGDKEFEAKIYAIEPKIDENTKTLRSRAMYSGSETFYPGSFVKVFVSLEKDSGSLMIPTQSVIPILKGQKVFVSRNGVAEEVKVITGIRTEDKIQILEGLNAGDTVLTTGIMAVKKGSKLKLLHTK